MTNKYIKRRNEKRLKKQSSSNGNGNGKRRSPKGNGRKRLIEPLWTPKKVARKLSCSVKTLANKRSKKTGLEYIKIGNMVRYEPSVVRKYIRENRHGGKDNA